MVLEYYSQKKKQFKMSNTKKLVYGLPKEIKYCLKCNCINQQPTSTNEYKHDKNTQQIAIEFNEDGICFACTSNQKKWTGEIDWNLKEKELVELCAKYKNFDGPYNCLVGVSGGKDSSWQTHILKHKYGMRPLTVTWAPNIYTNIGWKNLQNFINIGGFDNYTFTPNGKVHRYLTKQATINLLHPFQTFILGQKNFLPQLADKFKIPLIFYGENPNDYGRKVHNIKKFSKGKHSNETHPGYVNNPTEGLKFEDIKLGGQTIGYHLEQGFHRDDFACYLPLDSNKIEEKKIETHFLGYYLRWVPQENYYYAVKHAGFEPNTERTDGTYQKYASIDDRIDGFFYYTSHIKFGFGRAMSDSVQEVRNGHITKEEGLGLIDQFDGEFPKTFEKDFLEYISMSKEEFSSLCDNFRPKHIWRKTSNRWELKVSPKEFFKNLKL